MPSNPLSGPGRVPGALPRGPREAGDLAPRSGESLPEELGRFFARARERLREAMSVRATDALAVRPSSLVLHDVSPALRAQLVERARRAELPLAEYVLAQLSDEVDGRACEFERRAPP